MSKKSQRDYSAWRTMGKLVRDVRPIAWALALAAVVCIASVLLSSSSMSFAVTIMMILSRNIF